MRIIKLTEHQYEHLLGLAVDELNCAIKHGDDEARIERLRAIVAVLDRNVDEKGTH